MWNVSKDLYRGAEPNFLTSWFTHYDFNVFPKCDISNWNWSCCSPQNKCEKYEGNCLGDIDCEAGLECVDFLAGFKICDGDNFKIKWVFSFNTHDFWIYGTFIFKSRYSGKCNKTFFYLSNFFFLSCSQLVNKNLKVQYTISTMLRILIPVNNPRMPP